MQTLSQIETLDVKPHHVLAVIQVMASNLAQVASSLDPSRAAAVVDEFAKEISALNAALQAMKPKAEAA